MNIVVVVKNVKFINAIYVTPCPFSRIPGKIQSVTASVYIAQAANAQYTGVKVFMKLHSKFHEIFYNSKPRSIDKNETEVVKIKVLNNEKKINGYKHASSRIAKKSMSGRSKKSTRFKKS